MSTINPVAVSGAASAVGIDFLSTERRLETSRDAVEDYLASLGLPLGAHRGLAEYRRAARLDDDGLRVAAVNFLRSCSAGTPSSALNLAFDIAEDAKDGLGEELGVLLRRPEVAAIHPRLRLAEARRSIGRGDMVSAERHLQETVERFPCHGPAYRLLGEVCLSKGQVDRAARAFDCAAPVRPSRPLTDRPDPGARMSTINPVAVSGAASAVGIDFLSTERRLETSRDAVEDYLASLGLPLGAHRGLAEYRRAARLDDDGLRVAAVNFLRSCSAGTPSSALNLAFDIAEDAKDGLGEELGVLLRRPEVAAIHPRLRLAEARRSIGRGDMVSAERHLQETLERFPCHGPTYRLLGEVCLSKSQVDGAARAFDGAAMFWSRSWWLIDISIPGVVRIPGAIDGYEIFHQGETFFAVKVSLRWCRVRERWHERYLRWGTAIGARLSALAEKVSHSDQAGRNAPPPAPMPPYADRWHRLIRRAVNRLELLVLRLRGQLKAQSLLALVDRLDKSALGRTSRRQRR